MALQDESQGPFLVGLAGAARRGAGGVGAEAGPHGRAEGGTPWEQSGSVGGQAGSRSTASQGGGGCKFGGRRTAEKG